MRNGIAGIYRLSTRAFLFAAGGFTLGYAKE